MQAQKIIIEGLLDPYDGESTYDIFMAAFDDEELASQKSSEAMKRFIDLECQRGRQ